MSARDALLRLFDQRLRDAHAVFRLDGRDFRAGPDTAPCAALIRVHHPRFFSRVLGYGNLGLGEAFIDGDFTVEQGALTDFLAALLRNRVGDGFERRPALLLRAAGIRGGLLIHAATHHGVSGVGVTLSRDQQRVARERIAAAGLADRLSVRLADFAEIKQPFDRIVSVGMIEHLRPARYRDYFRHIAALLKPYRTLGWPEALRASLAILRRPKPVQYEKIPA